MRLRDYLSLFLVLGCLSIGRVDASQSGRHVTIEQPSNLGLVKVLLHRDIEAANLEVRGGCKIYDPRTGAKVSASLMNKQYLLRPTLDGIAWGEQYPGVFQIALIPRDEDTYILVNGIQYSGDLYVYQIGNTLSIVNVLSIEDFVKAMLNPKVNADLHPEVLAALSIVARTQAYFYSTRNESAFWHLDANQIGYQGACVCSRKNGVDNAVALTHHLVMKSSQYGNTDGYFDATYTSNCGGKTAPYHLIYRKEGFTAHTGVFSPLANVARDDSKWSFSILSQDLAEKLGMEKISKFELFSDSGKVYAIRFENSEEKKDFNVIHFQELLGEKDLKSTEFSVQYSDNVFSFVGYGEGPGTGLCLYSAQEMAKRGKNAAQILDMFFPESRITFMDIKKE
jgi:SpoIID/LytB domain protein